MWSRFSNPTKQRWTMCFHGTSAENAKKIRRTGFLSYTHFARHLEDAIGYGGDHVFWVAFPDREMARLRDDAWQFVIPRALPASRIVYLKTYTVKTLYENRALGDRIFNSNEP